MTLRHLIGTCTIALDAILSTKFVKSIRDKFQKKVNAKTYKV